jgi:1-acyl-sn-glycerol-3-phosphate acyltransferase
MFYALKLALIVVITVPATLLTILIGLFEPHGKHVYGISRCWTWAILRLGKISINVMGLDQIDPRQAYVFVANHQSNIDIPVLIQSLMAHQLRWIAKKELLWIPLFGWALWASKHIPLDRADSRSAMKSLRTARERIRAGISVVVFPEGTRSRDGTLLQFKKGGVLLALQTGTPIVPVTINGSRKVLPVGAWCLRPGTIEVIIGKPLAVAGFRPSNLRKLSAQVREAVEKYLQRPAAAAMTRSSWPDNQFVINTSLENGSLRS